MANPSQSDSLIEVTGKTSFNPTGREDSFGTQMAPRPIRILGLGCIDDSGHSFLLEAESTPEPQ
jgi:hypothetical protein